MDWKQYLPEFKEKTEAFYTGQLNMAGYKGFSGFYGSYAQKGGKASMLRLRSTGGRITADKVKFIADEIRNNHVKRLHFTTCETIQLHDLQPKAVYTIMEKALDNDIIVMGGGGDFPRNVMCAPLSGVEEEYFDVMPYALAAGELLMNYITAEKMPRKLKVCFSNNEANIAHATFRDLGFTARKDGKFDVYCCGGLGNNHKLGVKVADGIDPAEFGYYIHAMWLFFRSYGNYENRAKARTRYIQEVFETPEKFQAEFDAKLKEAYEKGDQLKLTVKPLDFTKKGDGSAVELTREIIQQKQEGLYAVAYHPVGGFPNPDTFCKLADAMVKMQDVELRLSGDETAFIINLTGDEAKAICEIIKEDNARTLFETSVSCVGAKTCQVGVRDSQGVLAASVEAVRAAGIKDGALPVIHVSGCPSSCGTHQIGKIGFRGGMKRVNDKPESAFVLYVGGCDIQGQEKFGEEVGAILDADIPKFLVELGKTVEASGLDYDQWIAKNPTGVSDLAKPYTE